jgi:hypothetical protein
MATKRHNSSKRKVNGMARVKSRAKLNGKAAKLTALQRRTLLELARNIKKYSPIIRRKLVAAGANPDSPFIVPTAMYYEALDRLAKE